MNNSLQGQATRSAGTTPNSTQLRDAHMRVLYLGLLISLLIPAGMLGLGLLLRQVLRSGQPTAADPNLKDLLLIVLLAAAVTELPVALILKKKLLKPLPTSGEPPAPVPSIAWVQSRYIVLYVLAMTPAVYGLVYFLLGGGVREFVLFAVVGLITFRLVRPSAEFFYSLFGARPAVE